LAVSTDFNQVSILIGKGNGTFNPALEDLEDSAVFICDGEIGLSIAK